MLASAPITPLIHLADIFPAEAVVIDLQHRAKAGVVAELVRRLVETERIPPEAERSLIETILAREKMGSTALGNGIAFPHCRSSVTETFVGAVGIDPEGVSFDAVDKGLVQIIFLLIGPLTNREQHFDILGRISSIGRNRAVRLQLAGCRSAERVNRVLREWDGDNCPREAAIGPQCR
jgi:mannitol/fructose-specific phosphotransferase system IIA component (Ntr-type)